MYGHVDPLCIWSWLCLDSVVNPLCMSSWLRLVSTFKYRSTLYFCGYTMLIIVTMDLHCIGWRPCLNQFLVLSIGYAHLSVDIIIYCCWLLFLQLCSGSPPVLSKSSISKAFQSSYCSLTSYFRGQSVTPQIPTLKCRKLSVITKCRILTMVTT